MWRPSCGPRQNQNPPGPQRKLLTHGAAKGDCSACDAASGAVMKAGATPAHRIGRITNRRRRAARAFSPHSAGCRAAGQSWRTRAGAPRGWRRTRENLTSAMEEMISLKKLRREGSSSSSNTLACASHSARSRVSASLMLPEWPRMPFCDSRTRRRFRRRFPNSIHLDPLDEESEHGQKL